MDDIVLRSMTRWPNVPSVFGWLQLDRRGQWRIKGERITNVGLTEFIGRNYTHDDDGRWYFQNGPQRVFVSLDYLPFVIRVGVTLDGLMFTTHTGQPVQRTQCVWMDEHGSLCIGLEAGAGSVHDQDAALLLPRLSTCDGQAAGDEHITAAMLAAQTGQPTSLWMELAGNRFPVEPLIAAQAPVVFGFIQKPIPAPGEPDC